MPIVGMEDYRRRSLISATLHTIQAKGTIDIRVSDIANHAGVSSGLAHHYFGSKENLILAALRHLLSEFRLSVIQELAKASTPREKISAIVSACLTQQQFSQKNVTAWLIFYAHAQESPQAQKLLRVYVRRLQSNLRYHLKPMVGDKSASIAEIVGSLIDGIFIRQALKLEKANSGFAKTLIEDCISMHIAAVSGS